MKKSRKRKGDPEERIQNPNGFLQDVKSLILEPKLGKARAEILGRQLLCNGGARHDALRATDTTHVLVDNDLTFSQILQHLKISQIPDGILVVRADWLSRCLVAGEKLPTVSYEVREETAKYINLILTSLPPRKVRLKNSYQTGNTSVTRNQQPLRVYGT